MSQQIVGTGWAFPPRIGVHGGLLRTNEANEIEQAVAIILSTAIGERVMRPTFGSQLPELLFEPINSRTLDLAEQYVVDALTFWEPRIIVRDVSATPDMGRKGRIFIDIEYEVKSNHDKRSLVYPFYVIPEED